MKNIIIILSIILLSFSVSCSKTKSSDSKFKIGILQLVEHAALDEASQGFIDGLKEAGYEDGKN